MVILGVFILLNSGVIAKEMIAALQVGTEPTVLSVPAIRENEPRVLPYAEDRPERSTAPAAGGNPFDPYAGDPPAG